MTSLSDAWARQLTEWKDIPGPFRPFVSADRPLPYLVYSPPDAWISRTVNARLTMLSDQEISVLENTTNGVRASVWLFADLDYVEQGAVHLYSWLRLSGLMADGPTVAQVEYNAAVAPLFTQVAQAVRETWTAHSRVVMGEEWRKLEDLAAVDYKLWSYARESVLPGERIFATMYQPEITVSRFLVSNRRLTVSYVCVLTDRELIFVSDDTGRYGIVRRYIPLTKIKEWQVEAATWEKTGIWQLQLPGERIAIHFSISAQSSLLFLTTLLNEAREKGIDSLSEDGPGIAETW